MRVVIVAAPGLADIVARCVSDNEVPDHSGWIARGFTNLKRILGTPHDVDVVVEELAKTVPQGHAVAGADEGSWALVGALALRLGIPAVLVRRTPKRYFLSYGDDPTLGDGRLAGERLAPGTPIHLVDDLVYSGATLSRRPVRCLPCGLSWSTRFDEDITDVFQVPADVLALAE